MNKLIGISGAIGSGKSSLGTALVKHEPDSALYETFQLVAEVGDAFNQALKAELEFATARNDIELVNQALIWLPDVISERLHHNVSWGQLSVKMHSTLVHPTLYRKLFMYIKQARADGKILDKPITAANKTTYRALLQWLGGYLIVKIGKTIWYDELMRRIKANDGKKKLIVICGVRYPSDAAMVRNAGGSVISIRRPGTFPNVSDITEVRRRLIKPDSIVLNNGNLGDLDTLAKVICSESTLKRRYRTVSKSKRGS